VEGGSHKRELIVDSTRSWSWSVLVRVGRTHTGSGEQKPAASRRREKCPTVIACRCVPPTTSPHVRLPCLGMQLAVNFLSM